MIKRNASKFYKTIAESMVWRALGFDKQKQLTNRKIDPKQIVFDTLSKYISQQYDLELFVLNAKYDPSKKPDPKVNIGRKIQLVSEFIETDAIDKLYYFKSLKDICMSFFACTAKDAEKQIEAFYKEQTDSFKQLTLDFNPSSPLKRKNSTDPISFQKRTKFASSNNREGSSKTKKKRPIELESNTKLTKKQKITDYFNYKD
ncbi:hypothetical protein F8M41_013247 [Gigaspora margarita]|uniref:Uncharacterized protein n=1 Tax=Gigaspora margarita TaxID=4874 RepID=A0A8H4ASC5_GIGMA|nr:hypothetical protein F8M41_013247 [Gigaspora margarita]